MRRAFVGAEAKLQADESLLGEDVRLEGTVVDTEAGDGLTNPRTDAVYAPLKLSDGTGDLLVSYDRDASHAPITSGAHVRVRGKYERVSVSGKIMRCFLATSVD